MQHTPLKLIQQQIGQIVLIFHYYNVICRDARAILERNIRLNSEGVVDANDKVYRGKAGYKNYITKDIAQVGSNKYTG